MYEKKYVLVMWLANGKKKEFTVLEQQLILLRKGEKNPTVGLTYKVDYDGKKYDAQIMKTGIIIFKLS